MSRPRTKRTLTGRPVGAGTAPQITTTLRYQPPPVPCSIHLTRDAAIEGRARIAAEVATLDPRKLGGAK